MNTPTHHIPTWSWHGDRAFLGDAALDELATKYNTPLYVYDFDHIKRRATELKASLDGIDHLICYAVKANSSLALLKEFSTLGLGADVVSGGELMLARHAGIDAQKIVFSGVAKTNEEIALGVKEGILSFNVESPGEIPRIIASAKAQNAKAQLNLRINPDIDAKTHPKIATGLHATKFGMETQVALNAAKTLVGHPQVSVTGVACHIGSQILDLKPMADAAKLVRDFANQLRAQGHTILNIDLGGGLGVAYEPEQYATVPTMKQYGTMLKEALKGDPARLLIEPGRCLVAEAGVLVARVIEVKKTGDKVFVMVDAAMTELIRPSLYDAYHSVVPVFRRKNAPLTKVDVVGSVCETGDYFAINRMLELPQDGDLVALTHTGAYGYSMSSNYNTRPRPAEIAVEMGSPRVIRKRERYEDLWRL